MDPCNHHQILEMCNEALTGLIMYTMQLFSMPHHYIKAVSLENLREWERQAEPTFQGWGLGCLGPAHRSINHHVFLMTFPNTTYISPCWVITGI